jgi:hypothetical protein
LGESAAGGPDHDDGAQRGDALFHAHHVIFDPVEKPARSRAAWGAGGRVIRRAPRRRRRGPRSATVGAFSVRLPKLTIGFVRLTVGYPERVKV